MNNEPSPLAESENEFEIGHKSDNDEKGDDEESGSGFDSSLDDDDLDQPIRTCGKFFINEEVARKRALEEKARTEAKTKD